MSGALIVGSVLYVWRSGRWRLAVVAMLAILLVGTTRPGTWGRIDFGHSYFDVKAPELASDPLVIMGYRHPMAYAAPFFRPDTRFVSPANNFLDVQQRNLLARRANDVIRGHRGALYLLAYKELDPFDERTLAHFGLVLDEPGCKVVPSSMDVDYMRICPLKRR